MKKTFICMTALALAAGLLLTGCGRPAASGASSGSASESVSSSADTLTGSLEEIAEELHEKAGNNPPMTFAVELTQESCESLLGLTWQQLEDLTQEAYVLAAAISADAHEMALIKCKDTQAVAEVKELVKNNFYANRWICVTAARCFVVESGSYLLLVASDEERARAIETAFTEMTGGNMGKVEDFHNTKSDL